MTSAPPAAPPGARRSSGGSRRWSVPLRRNRLCSGHTRAVTAHTERLQRLAHALHDHVHTWRLQPVVEALHALRGVQCTVAVPSGAELGDLTRFEHPRQLLNDLGLTPSEYSTGERRRQGGITKTGNTHAQRALIERAWASRYPAKVSRHLQLRLEQVPKPIQDLSWQAQIRRCKRYRQLSASGKHANQVVVALARELRALMWAMAQAVPLTPQTKTVESPAGVLSRVGLSSGRDAAPVWGNPRRREAAARHPCPYSPSPSGRGRSEGSAEPGERWRFTDCHTLI
jgi:Transposase IS116/IS110/IS902 family